MESGGKICMFIFWGAGIIVLRTKGGPSRKSLGTTELDEAEGDMAVWAESEPESEFDYEEDPLFVLEE